MIQLTGAINKAFLYEDAAWGQDIWGNPQDVVFEGVWIRFEVKVEWVFVNKTIQIKSQ